MVTTPAQTDFTRSAPAAGALGDTHQRIRRFVLVAMVLAIPLLFSLRLDVVKDPDIWWHLRAGQWMVAHHDVPRTDPFSSFDAGKPWVAYSWLFEVGVYGCYRAMGLLGIVAWQALLGLGVAAALYWLSRRSANRFTARLALTAAGLFAMVPAYAPRPWLLTIILIAIEIDLLLAARASGDGRRLLWLLPIFALWANIHIQFVYGLFVLALAIVEALLSTLSPKTRARGWGAAMYARLPLRNLLLVSAGCAAATLVNPYHFRIYRVVFDYASQPAVFNLISEFHALAFRDLPDFFVLLLTMGAAAALAWQHERSLFPALLLVSAAVLSFRSARDVWFVVIAATAIISWSPPTEMKEERQMNWHGALATLAAVALLGSGVASSRHLTNAALEKQLAAEYPVQAADEIEQRGYGGPLYNHLNWGGYLIWRLPQLPVSMDGRTNVYGDKEIARSVATWNAQPGWASDPELAAARLVIAGVRTPLFFNLRQDDRFRLVYEDRIAGLFVAKEVSGTR